MILFIDNSLERAQTAAEIFNFMGIIYKNINNGLKKESSYDTLTIVYFYNNYYGKPRVVIRHRTEEKICSLTTF